MVAVLRHIFVMEMETMNTGVQERMSRGVLKVCIKYFGFLAEEMTNQLSEMNSLS